MVPRGNTGLELYTGFGKSSMKVVIVEADIVLLVWGVFE